MMKKIMATQTIKVLVRECLLVLQQVTRTHPTDFTIINTTIEVISVLTIVVDLIMMVSTNAKYILLMMLIVIIHQEEDVMAGATILVMFIIIIHQQVDVMAGEDMHIMMVVVHTIMKRCLECKVQWDMRILWLEHKC